VFGGMTVPAGMRLEIVQSEWHTWLINVINRWPFCFVQKRLAGASGTRRFCLSLFDSKQMILRVIVYQNTWDTLNYRVKKPAATCALITIVLPDGYTSS